MSSWTDFVKKNYNEMKKKNTSVKLGDAMKHSAKLWKTQKHTTTSHKKGSRKSRSHRTRKHHKK
jgi:hypothetical protein